MLHRCISTRLNYAVRFSGCPIEKEETVAQHIAAMQLMALELYNIFLKSGLTFDIKDTMYRIAIHDLDEAALGDIPRPIKYYNDDVHRELDAVANAELHKNYHESIAEAVDKAKEGGFEGIVVNLLDSLQCVYRLRVSASFSKKFKSMLNESIEISRHKIEAIPVDTKELQLLKEVAWKELMDDEI